MSQNISQQISMKYYSVKPGSSLHFSAIFILIGQIVKKLRLKDTIIFKLPKQGESVSI